MTIDVCITFRSRHCSLCGQAFTGRSLIKRHGLSVDEWCWGCVQGDQGLRGLAGLGGEALR